MRYRVPLVSALLAAASLVGFTPRRAAAQGLKLAVGDVGLGIGDVPRLDGVRLNFRDRNLELVRGINATIWNPYEDAHGVVKGIALGLPLTGAAEIHGLALGGGVGADRTFSGIGVGVIGMGAGQGVRGVAIGGVGIGSGGELDGIMVGGVGAGAKGRIRGVIIGGVGAGTGGDLDGIAVGGIGLGAGGNLSGLAVGGVGVGAHGNVRGVMVGGVGVGAGGNVTGLMIGGVGVGAGGEMKGLAVGGVGVGAPTITGVALSGVAAGGDRVRGLVIAPAYFKIQDGGTLRGVSVSAVNRVLGSQHGLTIGLVNIADELHGLQLGVINIARNKDSFSVLPLVNWHR